jgi:hypothetical protein
LPFGNGLTSRRACWLLRMFRTSGPGWRR